MQYDQAAESAHQLAHVHMQRAVADVIDEQVVRIGLVPGCDLAAAHDDVSPGQFRRQGLLLRIDN